jgi:hypothetical protein
VPPNASRVRQLLRDFDFRNLFVQELGWDKHAARLPVVVDGKTYHLHTIAEKHGFQVFECPASDGGSIPDYSTRAKIERQVAKFAHEHIIIFVEADKSLQKWQWVRRELGRPLGRREYNFFKGQTGEELVQKLQYLAVDLSEEEDVTLIDVTRRARQAFDVDRITKRFYNRFKAEHTMFLKFVKGITVVGDCEWYASLMLNRLMFIYFIQKKGFLDGDPDYLRHRLKLVQQRKGKNKFLTFYRYFLVRLFHEGLGQPVIFRKKDLDDLLGQVPYLNGGLFDVHELEKTYPEIQISDEAFERLFDFFDAYRWHLDERPLRADNEINPDVLGYIFEKYINQKQMGAYYTKEDITGYISRSTIIPFLFTAAAEKYPAAFEPNGPVWQLLRDNPDRFIYEPVRRGVINKQETIIRESNLPEFVQEDIHDPAKRVFDKSYSLGEALLDGPANDSLTLPTETWREYVDRRNRCLELRAKLESGRVCNINDVVTNNLDVCQFTEDVIENCDSAGFLWTMYDVIQKVSVLDPTCGSGAFLFAALNVLEPLYEACLDRMQGFLEDAQPTKSTRNREQLNDFRSILEEVESHPSRAFFIFKSIVVNNLYGVDIMKEAAEICKLRLFLKLTSQVENPDQIEPLPDIDFNIRPGNTLVGFASIHDVQRTLEGTLGFAQESVRQIIQESESVDRAFKTFRKMQTERDTDAKRFADAKIILRTRLDELRHRLDSYLASEYGVETDKPKRIEQWRASHQPFHWLAEFYGVMSKGGFDVIIGNPPYVEYKKVQSTYRIEPMHYATESAQNLYAFCLERSAMLAGKLGRFGMIVPSSAIGLDETADVREVLRKRYSTLWLSTYSIRPSKLFDGVDQRLCIIVGDGNPSLKSSIYATRYHHWNSEERRYLFSNLSYVESHMHERLNRIAQLGSAFATSVLHKLEARSPHTIGTFYSPNAPGFVAYYHRSPRYWIRAMDFEQYFKSATRRRSVHHFRDLRLISEGDGRAVCAIINSSLFFFWFMTICNGRSLTNADVASFPVGDLEPATRQGLGRVFNELMTDYKKNSFIRKRTDCEYQEFRPSMSKSIIDKIDKILASHYACTPEELDFIVNYDIKYRMGHNAEDENDE